MRKPAVAAPLRIAFEGMKPGEQEVRIRRVGFKSNDAYTAYLEMGSPAKLDAAQLAQLQALTTDATQTQRLVVGRDGRERLDVPMSVFDVVLVEVDAAV